MRDPVLERSLTYRMMRDRNPAPSFRCPVCLVAYAGRAVEYSTRAISPLGRELYVVTCSRHYCRSRAQAFAFWPVTQSVFGVPHGNCFDSCVAMLFELRLEDVPHFNGPTGTGDWWQALNEWCAARDALPVFHPDPTIPPSGIAIAGGRHSRGRGLHACIAYDGRVVFDPNPARTGLTEITDYITIEHRKRPTERLTADQILAGIKRYRESYRPESVHFERQLAELDKDLLP